MKNYLSQGNRELLKAIREISVHADRLNIPAYIVGGCVRDLLLKRENLDLDIVTEGDAILLAKTFAQHHQASITIHERFGTAVIPWSERGRVDFATARRERYPYPGALPVVGEGTIRDDLFRRDFTINAMAIGINSDRWGQLVDEFGGWQDLKNKTMRVLHEKSFVDDPTRILRAVRFERRFRFRIEPKTLSLLKRALKEDFPQRVKPQRYFMEFKKILKEEKPGKALERLYRLRGLDFLARGLALDVTLLRRLEKKVFALKHRPLLTGRRVEWWLIYLMAVLERLSRRKILHLGSRFNLARQERQKILMSTEAKKAANILKKKIFLPHQVYSILKPLSIENILYLWLASPSRRITRRVKDFLTVYERTSLFINGNDLKRLGIPANEHMRKILRNILDKRIDGLIRSRREELEEAQRFLRKFK